MTSFEGKRSLVTRKNSHDNSGPKFGIRLLGRNCTTTASLLWDVPVEKTDSLLHIPTSVPPLPPPAFVAALLPFTEHYSPWHNTVVKIQGREGFLVVKSRLVREAVDNGYFTAFWIEGDVSDGSGGYYSLTGNRLANTEPSKL